MDSIKDNWDLIKETLREEYELTDISYNTWIVPLNFYQVKNNVVMIIIPSDQAHALNYISSKYKSYFQVTISEMMNHTYDIAFILEKDVVEGSLDEDDPVYNMKYEHANLNPKYKFDTFVVGSNNKFAPLGFSGSSRISGRNIQSSLYLWRSRSWQDAPDAFDRALHTGTESRHEGPLCNVGSVYQRSHRRRQKAVISSR